jgi:hypothetical protein
VRRDSSRCSALPASSDTSSLAVHLAVPLVTTGAGEERQEAAEVARQEEQEAESRLARGAGRRTAIRQSIQEADSDHFGQLLQLYKELSGKVNFILDGLSSLRAAEVEARQAVDDIAGDKRERDAERAAQQEAELDRLERR